MGIVPEPPKPPDVLGQHSDGSTVLHPAMSVISKGEAIESKDKRMEEPFSSVRDAR
jgi:hypothetical protein